MGIIEVESKEGEGTKICLTLDINELAEHNTRTTPVG